MSADRNVLVVEDEPKIARLLCDYLAAEGFASEWLATGKGVVEHIRSQPPDAVLLDIMLPEVDGISICRQVREFSNVPIIMLTARIEEIDRILGLEVGADDYVCKPFSPREVMARIKALFRRIDAEKAPSRSGAAGFEIDEAQFSARVNGQALDLTAVEFRLLSTLMANPGRVYSRAQLLDRVYTDHRVVADRTVDSHIKNLRKKIAAAGADPDAIRSVYGVGYRWEPAPGDESRQPLR